MKTFKQFLTEENTVELSAFIKKHCSKYIDDYHDSGVMLFRGAVPIKTKNQFALDGNPVAAEVKQTRKDRQPLNTPAPVHQFLDNWFKKKFGVAARSSAVFAFPFYSAARGFGQPSILVPIGSYNVVWSRDVEDLTVKIYPDNSGSVKPTDVIGGEDEWGRNTTPDMDEQLEALERIMNHANYEITDELSFKMQRQELMIVCDSYLQISCASSENVRTFKELFDKISYDLL